MSSKKTKAGIIADWIEYRLPIFSFLKYLGAYRVPKNLNYMWSFGAIAGIGLVIQIITGIFLAMHYSPSAAGAFDNVEYIMRNVNYGWLLRYLHAVGASMFFIAVYMHMARSLYYGSYKKPRELVWFLGLFIFFLMMATAFTGYVLPWGQMSFWGATVITNLFSAIPIIGENIVQWLCGGFSISDPTLSRFFVLHYLLPFIIVVVVLVHIIALHVHGSNNPKGVEVKSKKDTVPFHPYYTVKDLFGLGVYLIIFAYFVFYQPNYLGHPDNYVESNPMVTPAHILPEWYFLPFYGILKAVPNKLLGVILMFSSILVLFFLPWLDRSEVKSGAYRPIFKKLYWVFLLDVIVLGYVGSNQPDGIYIILGRIATFCYFLYFLFILPFLGKYEKTLPLPKSISSK